MTGRRASWSGSSQPGGNQPGSVQGSSVFLPTPLIVSRWVRCQTVCWSSAGDVLNSPRGHACWVHVLPLGNQKVSIDRWVCVCLDPSDGGKCWTSAVLTGTVVQLEGESALDESFRLDALLERLLGSVWQSIVGKLGPFRRQLMPNVTPTSLWLDASFHSQKVQFNPTFHHPVEPSSCQFLIQDLISLFFFYTSASSQSLSSLFNVWKLLWPWTSLLNHVSRHGEKMNRFLFGLINNRCWPCSHS